MHVDTNGLLVADSGDPQVIVVPSPRHCDLEVPQPLGHVWHCTEVLTDGGTLQRRISSLPNSGQHPASWHNLIGKDGAVRVSVPASKGSWHVGKPGVVGGKQVRINYATIGTEIENAGRLRLIDGEFYCWPYWRTDTSGNAHQSLGVDPSLRVDSDRAVKAPAAAPWGSGYFDKITDAQVASAEAMLRAYVDRFGWTREVCALGHYQFDPGRKEDPGPLWMLIHLPAILDRIFTAGVCV